VRIKSVIRVLATASACLVSATETAMSQQSAQNYPYPINDIAVALPSGTVVRVRNIVVFQGGKGHGSIRGVPVNALTLYIETPTPSTEPERLATEAQELLGLKEKLPAIKDATIASVGICRSRLCLEMKETPQEMFTFVRRVNGSWERQERPGSR
jgi:hypothetical protein